MAGTGTTPDGDPGGGTEGRPAAPLTRRARRVGGLRREQGSVEEAVRRIFAPHLATRDGARLWARWRGTLRLLRPLGALSLGNTIEVLVDGDAAFEAKWSAVDAARRRVLLNTYTLEPDRVGRRTVAGLARAARRGCEVRLVCDAFGSPRAGRLLATLRRAGGRAERFNPLLRFPSRLSRLSRNHKKILVADEVGFCGGMNVSEDYAGERHGNGLFRDTQLLLRGPCVEDLAALVGEEEVVDEPLARPAAHAASAGGALVQVLESNVARHRRAIQRALHTTVRRAVRRCYLTSPYFVPTARLIRELRRAAARGVDVCVLTAGRSDVPAVRLASRHLYGRLLRAGVRVFEMEERVLHAKTVTIDGVYASVGSFNLDYWSYRRNLEVTVTSLDPDLAGGLERQFSRDLELSREVPLRRLRDRTWIDRGVQWLAYLLLRL